MLGKTTDFTGYISWMTATMQGVDIDKVQALADDLLHAFEQDQQVFVIGNGGMAAVAAHVAEDFTSQLVDRDHPDVRFRVHDLTSNSAWILAIGNDYGFDQVFVEQLHHYAQKDDFLLALSCSGDSPDIVKAIEFAHTQHMTVWGVTSETCSHTRRLATETLRIPHRDTGIVQDAAMTVLHWVLGWLHTQIHEPKDDDNALETTADSDAGVPDHADDAGSGCAAATNGDRTAAAGSRGEADGSTEGRGSQAGTAGTPA
jgi:D-sedoheptulose 7-phosphate isomerase